MINYSSAIDDFRRAHRRAIIKEILSRFTRTSNQLLSYDEVRQSLKAQSSSERGLMDIPLDAIIGSVNRYNDFTRDFLPKDNIQGERWARVEMAATDQAGLSPIEVYQIGDAYFVKDGNHRVSIARQTDAKTIQAYVTEVRTRVPLTVDTRPEDLIIKAEYVEFLEKTHLDEIRPSADLSLTAPGEYPILEEHIAVHRYFMGLDEHREISYEEAAGHWYDTVYQPVAHMIVEKGILRYFPDRTEADLYLWLADHRAALVNELGIDIKPSDAAADLADRFSSLPEKVINRLGSRVLNTILPDTMEGGPPPGQWRKEKLANLEIGLPADEHVFSDILVPVSGQENGWQAVDQAILIAQRESGRLHGLHVLPPILNPESPAAQEVHDQFTQRCQAAKVPGSFHFASGDVTQNIIDRARWNDLVVVYLNYPPSTQPMTGLNHGFRNLLQRSVGPVMAVTGNVSRLSKALLAFDGSPKSQEALFLAAYLSGGWDIPLCVISVLETGRVGADVLDEARRYLEGLELEAKFIQAEGPNDRVILNSIEDCGCDFLMMGGYSRGPILDILIGSTVNRVLNEVAIPVLICR